MKHLRTWILLSLLTLLLSVGCNVGDVGELEPIDSVNGATTESEKATALATSASNTAVPTIPTEDLRSLRLTPVTTPEIEIVPTTAVTPVAGEVPQAIMTAVYDDLTTSVNVPKETIAVTRAEAIVWSDGSLGCPQPGQVYTQAPVNGYRIVLEANNQTYDYHAAENGYFVLCQNSLPVLPTPVGTPTS